MAEKVYYRECTLERGEKGEVTMSISSDAPCYAEDHRGQLIYEVLDHSPGGFDDTRLRSGLPILYNHKKDTIIGRAGESYSNDGHKIKVGAKFSGAEDVRAHVDKVNEGTLRDTSVGYTRIGRGEKIGEKNGVPVMKYRWKPHEVSMVPVPMDDNTGIGRGATDETEVPEKKNVDAPANDSQARETTPIQAHKIMSEQIATPEPKIDVVAERSKAVEAERARVGSIQNLSRHFAEKGLGGRKIDTAELASKFINEGKTERDFRDAVMEGNFNEAKPVETQERNIGLSEKEKRSFSFTRALACLAKREPIDGLEKEASDAHGKLIGRQAEVTEFFIPQDVWRAPAFPNGMTEKQRALFANVFAGAGAFVGTDLLGGSLIELLRNAMYVVQMGARTMSGLKGNVSIPRHTGGATASWLAEDSTATRTQQAVGQLNLVPHKLMAATAYTQQLLQQSSVDVENFVRQDLMAVIALARDLAAINGSGVQGEPQGIIGLSGLSTPVTLAAAESLTYAKALEFEQNVALNNAAVGKLGYLTGIKSRYNAKSLAKFANTGIPVWENDIVNGHPAKATNQMPTATGVLFGNWDDLILADWADTSVLVDPYSLSLQSQISVVMQMLCDNGVRHATSFARGTT